MGFTKKTWKNRIAEYINRRKLTMEDGSTNLVTVARDEGTISQEGDAFNAANMNDLEDRIEAGFEEVSQSLTYKKIATLSGTTAQSIDFTKYKEILLIAFVRGGYCSMVIPIDMLNADEQWFNLNYNDVNLNVAAMSFKISKTSARIYQLTYATTDYTAKAVAQVYAK